MYSSTLSLTLALDEGGWSIPRPDRFTPGKETRYPLYRRLGRPQGLSGRLRKISPPAGFFFSVRGLFPFNPFLYCLNPFVLHVTLRSILPSLRQTRHKHPCPRWDFFFLSCYFPLIHFVLLNPSVLLHVTYDPY
jgi:hypothetical protein